MRRFSSLSALLSNHHTCIGDAAGPWKYLYYFEDEREELYYLPADEGENHNLMATRPEVMQRMRSQLRSWWEEVDAPMPEKRPERP